METLCRSKGLSFLVLVCHSWPVPAASPAPSFCSMGSFHVQFWCRTVSSTQRPAAFPSTPIRKFHSGLSQAAQRTHLVSLQGQFPAPPAQHHSDFSAILRVMTISSKQDLDLSPRLASSWLLHPNIKGSGCSLCLLLYTLLRSLCFFTSQSFIIPIPYCTSLFYLSKFPCPNYSVVSDSWLDSDWFRLYILKL